MVGIAFGRGHTDAGRHRPRLLVPAASAREKRKTILFEHLRRRPAARPPRRRAPRLKTRDYFVPGKTAAARPLVTPLHVSPALLDHCSILKPGLGRTTRARFQALPGLQNRAFAARHSRRRIQIPTRPSKPTSPRQQIPNTCEPALILPRSRD
jgi:hypothetical protein